MASSIYINLTHAFNGGERLRCIVSSGQAVVLYQLAMMSKDGDWIVHEDAQSFAHVLQVLEEHGARYRLGAPLDGRGLERTLRVFAPPLGLALGPAHPHRLRVAPTALERLRC